MRSVNMFIEYVHFFSEDNDITFRSHCSPPWPRVSVKLRPVFLKDESYNALPSWRPVITRRNNQITGPEKVSHFLTGTSVWKPTG